MDLELVKFINSDLTWNAVKKGRRSMMRRPRKPGASSFAFGFGLGNKMEDSAVFDYEKSGVAVLGQHFAEEVLDIPIKKRILMLQSPSLNGERAMSPRPQTPSPHHEESGQLVGRKHASGQLCHSNSLSNIQELKFKNGSSDSELLKLTKKEVSGPDDFSGIELLAATACGSSVHQSSDHVESSVVEEHTTPIVDSYTDGMKESAPMDLDDSAVQDITSMQNLCDDGSGQEDERLVPPKGVRLHWDLNTVMYDWEEPCYDILVDPRSQKSYVEGFYNDDLQNAKANLEGYETRNSEVTGGDQGRMLRSVCENQCGKNDAAISVSPLIKRDFFGIQGNNDGESVGKGYDAEDIASSREVMGTITCKTSDAESCQSKSDVVDSFVHPTKRENFSTSTAVSLKQTVVKVEADTIHGVPISFEPSKKFDDRQPVSEAMLQGRCRSLKVDGDGGDKLTSEDRLSDCCGSNVSQDERAHLGEGNTLDKVKAGYDSPVEDGELRESIGYAWQKNEIEERDCVDYEYDNVCEDNFNTIESEKNEVTLDHGQTIGGASFLLQNRALGVVPNHDSEQGAEEDASKRSNCLLGKASEYRPQENSEYETLEENNGSSGEFLPDRKIGYDKSRTLGGNSLYVGRSTSFDVRRTDAYMRRSRSDNIEDSYSRAERDFGPERLMGKNGPSYQSCGRNAASGQRVDSSMGVWDSRTSHVYPRARNDIGGPTARSGESSSLDHNQPINYNPRGIYRTFNRRPSPSDRNESYGIHRGTPPARGVSRDRCRGGSGFHLQGLRRAPPEEYHDPEPCFSERKVHRFSPNFNRGDHLSRSRRRSRSRSRSGSPIAWHFQKRRNVDTKQQSPDCWPDTRFQGERFPFRKPSFSGETEADYVSPTRRHLSPQRISRSFDDRNITNGEFRDRRLSPVRAFQRGQRFEASGLGRLKANDHFRPTPHSGRFPQKFEDNSNDSRMHNDEYGTTNGGRRFRYPVDDSFKAYNPRNKNNGFRYVRNENRFKDPFGRDFSENTSEEKGCRYNINKMFTTSLLSSGEGNFNKDDLQRE